MLKALFQDSMAGYLIVITIVGATVTIVGWALYWRKKMAEERKGSYALQAHLGPHPIHARLDRLVHDDGASPLARGFPFPLVGRVNSHLAAQA